MSLRRLYSMARQELNMLDKGKMEHPDSTVYYVRDKDTSVNYHMESKGEKYPADHCVVIVSRTKTNVTSEDSKAYTKEEGFFADKYSDNEFYWCINKLLTGGEDALYCHLEVLHKQTKDLEEALKNESRSIHKKIGED